MTAPLHPSVIIASSGHYMHVLVVVVDFFLFCG
jgi:hypothetical protein